MAKALYLEGFADPAAVEYLELYRLILEKSVENKLISPTSNFHRRESDRSTRVKNIVWRVSDYLAADTPFIDSALLLQRQVFGAAQRFVRTHDNLTPNRQNAFANDPDRVFPEGTFRERIQVHLATPAEWLEFENEMSGNVAGQFGEFRAERIAEGLGFEEEVRFHRTQFSRETLVDPVWVAQRSGLDMADPMTQTGILAQLGFHNELSGYLSKHGKSMESFVDSEELNSIPIIDIRAKLTAADTVCHANETPAGSFRVDLEVVSNFLPYVDILTTDGAVKERMRQSGLTREWHAEVFSNRRRDRHDLIARIDSL